MMNLMNCGTILEILGKHSTNLENLYQRGNTPIIRIKRIKSTHPGTDFFHSLCISD